MALINRFSRLFTADMHAVMDRIEEPDILLKQALRDMEAAVAATEQRLRRIGQQRLELGGALERAAEQLGDLAGQLQVCLEAGNDDLARSVIRRKLRAERRRGMLEAELKRAAAEQDELAETLARQRDELAELSQKAEVFEVADASLTADAMDIDVTDADVEVALLKEKQRRAES